MKKQIKVLRYFIYLAVLIIGIVIGIAIRHYKEIPLSQEVNLVDVATLVVTVFLAVYIPEVLDRKLQGTRDKKILIELRISEFQTLMKKVNMLVQDYDTLTANDYLTVRNTLDVARNKLETIISLIQYANFQKSFVQDAAKLRVLTEKHQSLLVNDKHADISSLAYGQEIKMEEENLYNSIDKTSSLLIIRISDM